MSISKKKDSPYWYTRFTICGIRIQESTKCTNRAEAEEYEEKRRREIRQQLLLGKRPGKSWSEAALRWLKEMQHKRSYHSDISILRWVNPRLENYRIGDITKDVLEKLAQEKEAEGASGSTVNRIFCLVRAILNRAYKEWDWLDRVPSFPKRHVNNARDRWLTHDEAIRLLAELPNHLRAMAAFTLETGLRASNVMQLKWSQVDLVARHVSIPAAQTKNAYALGIPLTMEAVKILRAQIGKHQEFVFVYDGHPVRQCCTKAWFKAVARAGLQDFRWHDLRHTWASWHIQRGTPLNELYQLGGWRSYDMVLRYAHLSTEHLKKTVDNFSGAELVKHKLVVIK